jgi:hypothetical protein
MEKSSGEKLEHLQALVQRHEVCWDVYPVSSATTDGQTLQVGYEVVIAGIFNDPKRPAETIRVMTDEVLAALREVTTDLREHANLPDEHRIKSFDEGVQASAKRDRSEARIKLALLHKEAFHVAVDEKLTSSLRLMESRLTALGASKGSWTRH